LQYGRQGEIEVFENLGNLVGRFWEHGQYFLSGCAAACILGFLLLLGGRFFGFDAASEMLAAYGLALLLGVVLFASLAAARWWESRPKKQLFFVAEEEQSIWGHSRQPSGDVLTSFNVRMHITNTSDTSVHISRPRILRPWRARWREQLTGVLMTRNPQFPTDNTYSQDFPIRPHGRSHTSGVIALKGAICKPGKRLTFVVAVLDNRGRKHRIKFKRVRASNTDAV
jgi:hypothetical protein